MVFFFFLIAVTFFDRGHFFLTAAIFLFDRGHSFDTRHNFWTSFADRWWKAGSFNEYGLIIDDG